MVAEVTQTIHVSYPFLQKCSLEESAALGLPQVWWSLHADGAPEQLRAIAAQVFSLPPTSAAGERSFKQCSRVHTRTRSRLASGSAEKTQATFFNKRKARLFFDGVLLKARGSAAEKRLLDMLGVGRSEEADRAPGAGADYVKANAAVHFGAQGEHAAVPWDDEDMAFWSLEDGGTVADARNQVIRLLSEAAEE